MKGRLEENPSKRNKSGRRKHPRTGTPPLQTLRKSRRLSFIQRRTHALLLLRHL
nr:MAG TPA: hypothetical protein [Caudoviricetes sp.]